MRRRLAALSLIALALTGCGLGEGGERGGGAELRVTRDFGRERLGSARLERVREGDTVMRFLRSRFDVETRYGGRFVQGIDGLEGKGPSGKRDWFYFVNGVEADVGAAEYELSAGDLVQWDYRRWDVSMRAPAIVGAFPQPFVGGVEGRRLPVRVECEDAASAPCREVKRRLRARGIAAGGAPLGAAGAGGNLIRVIVARWGRARLVRAASPLERGPSESGVFARFGDRGRTLELLDQSGRVARRVRRGTGLIAAVAPSQEEIVWLLTAPDGTGLARAARSLDERRLRDGYAVAAGPAGVERLPLEER